MEEKIKSDEEVAKCAAKVIDKSLRKIDDVDSSLVSEGARDLTRGLTDKLSPDELRQVAVAGMLRICKKGRGREFLDFLGVMTEEMQKKGRSLTEEEMKEIFIRLKKGV